MVQQDNGPCMPGSSLVLPSGEPHSRKSRACFVSQPFKLTEQCTRIWHPVQGMELKQGQDTSRETYILLKESYSFPSQSQEGKSDTCSCIGLTRIFCDTCPGLNDFTWPNRLKTWNTSDFASRT